MKKKNSLLITFLLATTLVFAQFKSLELKIPSNAQVVISIDGNHITDLLSIANFDTSEIGQLLQKELSKNNADFNSISDLGFNLDAKAYYFQEVKDSVSYYNFMLKFNSREDFEKVLSQKNRDKIEIQNNTRFLDLRGDITVWNDDILIVSFSKSSTKHDTENTLTSSKNYALNLLKASPLNSIVRNTSYSQAKNKKATASVWIKNYSDFMNMILADALSSLRTLGIPQNIDIYGINAMHANLFFNNDNIELKTTMHINKEWHSVFNKIYNKRFNKKFYKYFNQDNALAYFNLTMSTQGLLESYPDIMANTYGNIFSSYKEETEIAANLLNILLDEEAIEELVGGDFLFVLNDLKQQEISYTSYDYDADYNKKEVTKTKQELLPDFTLMMSSKNEKFLGKIMRLGIKHEILGDKGSYCAITQKELPIDLFVGIKNDIVFLTSSEKRLQQIMLGTFKSSLGKHKKILSKNAMTIYVNGTEIIKKIPEDMYNFNKKFDETITGITNKRLEVQLSTSKFKGSKIHTNLIINTPEKEENSLKFFFNLINELISAN